MCVRCAADERLTGSGRRVYAQALLHQARQRRVQWHRASTPSSQRADVRSQGRVENKKLWLPDNNNFASWKTQVPKGFKFGFKLNEGLTHCSSLCVIRTLT